jgi:hypothetical protein
MLWLLAMVQPYLPMIVLVHMMFDPIHDLIMVIDVIVVLVQDTMLPVIIPMSLQDTLMRVAAVVVVGKPECILCVIIVNYHHMHEQMVWVMVPIGKKIVLI